MEQHKNAISSFFRGYLTKPCPVFTAILSLLWLTVSCKTQLKWILSGKKWLPMGLCDMLVLTKDVTLNLDTALEVEPHSFQWDPLSGILNIQIFHIVGPIEGCAFENIVPSELEYKLNDLMLLLFHTLKTLLDWMAQVLTFQMTHFVGVVMLQKNYTLFFVRLFHNILLWVVFWGPSASSDIEITWFGVFNVWRCLAMSGDLPCGLELTQSL